MATKIKIRKGDSVQVLTGKDAGKRGTVLRVVPTERRIVVEKLISNVALVCPACGEPTRVGYRMKDDHKVRTCHKCGKDVDR